MGTYIGLTIYLPVYFETVRGLSASHSGLALIPLMAGTVVGATLSGRSMAKVKHYKRLPIAGLLVAMATTGLLAGLRPIASPSSPSRSSSRSSASAWARCCRSPWCRSRTRWRRIRLGTATGTANFFRSLGGAFIVAIFGAIVIGGSGLSGAASFEALGAAAAQSGVDLAHVFSYVFVAALIGFGLSLAFLLALEERPLRGTAVKAAEAAIAD